MIYAYTLVCMLLYRILLDPLVFGGMGWVASKRCASPWPGEYGSLKTPGSPDRGVALQPQRPPLPQRSTAAPRLRIPQYSRLSPSQPTPTREDLRRSQRAVCSPQIPSSCSCDHAASRAQRDSPDDLFRLAESDERTRARLGLGLVRCPA